MAEASLERHDFMRRDLTEGTMGDDLVCQDWEVLIQAMEDNYDEFQRWNHEWN